MVTGVFHILDVGPVLSALIVAVTSLSLIVFALVLLVRAGLRKSLAAAMSSEPLGESLAERAAFDRWYGVAAIVSFTLLQLSFVNFYARAFGSDEPAQVVDHRYSTSTDGDGHTSRQDYLMLRIDGNLEAVHVSGRDFRRVQPGSLVAIRRDFIGWEVGDGAALHLIHASLAVLWAAGLMSAFAVGPSSIAPGADRSG